MDVIIVDKSEGVAFLSFFSAVDDGIGANIAFDFPHGYHFFV